MHPVTPPEAEEPKRSGLGWLLPAAHPRTLLEMASGYPVGLKQFLQFCLLLIYPGWLLVLLAYPFAWALGQVVVGVLWVLFWPVRAALRSKE